MYNLWEIRKRKGLSVSQLAARSGVSAQMIHSYEQGSQEIPFNDLGRLAKALYVEEWEIKIRSDPPLQRKAAPKKARGHSKPRRPAKKAAAPKKPRPLPPIRETQIEQIDRLLKRLDRSAEALQEQLGKPVSTLSQKEASRLLNDLQQAIAQQRSKEHEQNMQRPYLPESVDKFELNFLQACQDGKASLRIVLFDGTTLSGLLVGFGPYQIVIENEAGEQVSINKLAISYYRCLLEQSDEQ